MLLNTFSVQTYQWCGLMASDHLLCENEYDKYASSWETEIGETRKQNIEVLLTNTLMISFPRGLLRFESHCPNQVSGLSSSPRPAGRASLTYDSTASCTCCCRSASLELEPIHRMAGQQYTMCRFTRFGRGSISASA